MKQYRLKLEIISSSLIGSGEGFGAIIDSDIVFDDVGIPYIPAKRIKGCLLDSALEVKEIFDRSEINFPIEIEETFGLPGKEDSAPVYFSNLTIEEYEDNKEWLEYFLDKNEYSDFISKERILNTFTEIRQQTAIAINGVALPHSLRTSRVIKNSIIFYGNIEIYSNKDENILNTIILACLNFRRMGTKRNRGFGEVRCSIFDGEEKLSVQQRLEELCTK